MEEIISAQKKWETIYADENYQKELSAEYDTTWLPYILKNLAVYTDIKNGKGRTFLELGCGMGFVMEWFSQHGWNVIGVDFSKSSIDAIQKRFEKNGIKNYQLIHSTIQDMQIPDNSIDLIYGGGVIEHFKDTVGILSKLYRCLKPKGICYNSVPAFGLVSMIYRFRWGGIPNIPILKQIAEIVNIRLLKEKTMIFGYELQFTKRQLYRYHFQSGFNKVQVNHGNPPIQLSFIKNQWLRKWIIKYCDRIAIEYIAVGIK